VIVVEEEIKTGIKFKKETNAWVFKKEFYRIWPTGLSPEEKKGKT